jgi:hypothetical protein
MGRGGVWYHEKRWWSIWKPAKEKSRVMRFGEVAVVWVTGGEKE